MLRVLYIVGFRSTRNLIHGNNNNNQNLFFKTAKQKFCVVAQYIAPQMLPSEQDSSLRYQRRQSSNEKNTYCCWPKDLNYLDFYKCCQ